ncbi:MAG: AMP-binding protein [Rhodospirillaceae bacterium]|jgi:long-chain acyl-CoA synthetase|nr:AMP-binding protein [Rhodospirillaceae bacterium]MBT5080868.1 AMP-binding protein [Rhodospirillaceae bacterium]MBT5525289.1 AMP-binding protein [Rhodospirillaceae bacterium]MBT5877858.1 AMP-binding protein [Rhodospirillaceae bacterium]MBT6592167.1 AMP-binding protein [Rhodospirillaceae bacterium]
MSRPWEKYYTDEAKAFDVATMPYATIPAMINSAGAEFANRSAATTILPNGATATITYAELLSYANDFAAYLRETAGLQRGETVALMTPNCIDFNIASCGAFLAGAVCTNINPLYTAPEMEHQLNDSKAKVLVIIDMFGDKVDEVVANTGVRQVVTISLLEFFPTLKKLIIGFVLKRVKKVIPDLRHAHTKFADALASGSSARKGGDIAAYTEGLQGTDTALFQYTSGTTGRSKGAELSHQGILANAHQANTLIGHLRLSEGDTTLVILPLYHITAFALIFVVGMGAGDHLVLVPSPRPPSNLQSAFENFEVTIFTGINTLFAALMEEPWFDKSLFKSVNFCGSGGAAQQTGVAQRWEDATGIEIYQGYGMTECCGVMSLNPVGDNRLGSVGIPVPGLAVKIIDDDGVEQPIGSPGELLFKGPTIMKGYFGRPEATAETIVDGWLHSGDIAIMDEDGFLEIVDRKKDMILVSGFNVSPNEIEDVIAKIPGVVEVGVVGIPDEKSSETPMAFIVKNNDLTEEAVTAACREALTNYKVPKHIKFIDDIPKSPVGKVLRRELRDMVV